MDVLLFPIKGAKAEGSTTAAHNNPIHPADCVCLFQSEEPAEPIRMGRPWMAGATEITKWSSQGRTSEQGHTERELEAEEGLGILKANRRCKF